MSRKGGDDENKSDLIDNLLYLPITYRYMQIQQAKNGEMDLEDVLKLNEICLCQEEQKREALKDGKKCNK